jgi:xylan 1,4-beta-xylosidase
LIWHYHDDDVAGPDARISLSVAGVRANRQGQSWRVDPRHANSFAAWQAMGSPQHPTAAQIARLTQASRLTAEPVALHQGKLDLVLPRQGVVLIELAP